MKSYQVILYSPPIVTKETKQSPQAAVARRLKEIMSCPQLLSHRCVLKDVPVSAGIGRFDKAGRLQTTFSEWHRPVQT